MCDDDLIVKVVIVKGDNRIIGFFFCELVVVEVYYYDYGYWDYIWLDKVSKNLNCKSVFDWDEVSYFNIEF